VIGYPTRESQNQSTNSKADAVSRQNGTVPDRTDAGVMDSLY